jgi:hypothetical protein
MSTDKISKPEVRWGPCCFCGKEIDENQIDPCRVTVETTGGKWQLWFCHGGCFEARISSETEIDLSPAHF